jgi:hypothetical protein
MAAAAIAAMGSILLVLPKPAEGLSIWFSLLALGTTAWAWPLALVAMQGQVRGDPCPAGASRSSTCAESPGAPAASCCSPSIRADASSPAYGETPAASDLRGLRDQQFQRPCRP